MEKLINLIITFMYLIESGVLLVITLLPNDVHGLFRSLLLVKPAVGAAGM